jgi:hypothetical protein
MGYDQIMVEQAKSRVLRDLGVDIEPAKLILDESLGADENGDFGGATNYVDRNTSGNKIIEGKSYTVTTDSGSYTSVCKKISFGDESLLFVGNGKLFGLEDTGESFFVSSQFDVNSYLLICADFNSGNHIKAELAETIHHIDPKFLPGVCLPKVLNLAEYGNMNDILAAYVGNGGGAGNNIQAGAFWKDANTDSPLQLVVTTDEMRVVINADSIIFMDGELYSVAFNFMMILDASPIKITVCISRSTDATTPDGVAMYVTVEPISISA